MAAELPNTQKLFDLSGISALITGGAGALGSIAAKALAGAGASVSLSGGNLEKLDAVVNEIIDAGGNGGHDQEVYCQTDSAELTRCPG